ncbi:60 kDa SS-A/Ro ribonucleoprotein-like [Actinia tenebrosa]|uniref:RNA-binding protein RO60 n=1 Tax=Actinia tenebrosa TaxID=6105 RepID=A0A6P8HZQ9_ACTTE|nr:60 kDa SS-A/Ro ribonucleoprotein-like [Actinia tenebrosa]
MSIQQQQRPLDVEMHNADDETAPQNEPLSTKQVKNEAGGYTFVVDNMCRLKRFIVLGSEGGTYYAGEKELSQQNATCLMALIEEGKGPEAVEVIKEYSVEGRTAKQDPIIFALAMFARCSDLNTKRKAYEVLNDILRIPTHLFIFVENCENLSKPKTGWGRAHRKAICKWYTQKKAKNLAMHVTKYKQRNGWSHRDLFRLCHIKPDNPSVQFVVRYVVKGLTDELKKQASLPGVSQDISNVYEFLDVVERAKDMNEDELTAAIRGHGLVREHIPTDKLKSPEIWKALLEKMPMTAMIRNLGKMTSIGILEPLTDEADKVTTKLRDMEALKAARIHPFNVLVALKLYGQGHGDKGKLSWEPNSMISSALDDAYYLSFKAVEPTNKRFLLALDVSGSMSWGNCVGTPGITPAVATAAMAMVTARTETKHHFVGFSHELVPINIKKTDKLETVMQTISHISMGGTDCAQPMLYATKKKLKVDVFIIYTDCETHSGKIHPSAALKKYREQMQIDAKLIVVAMTSNGFTLADPEDSGMLDIAGFDSAAPQVIREFVMGGLG